MIKNLFREMFENWLILWNYDKNSFFMFGIIFLVVFVLCGIWIFQLLRVILC